MTVLPGTVGLLLAVLAGGPFTPDPYPKNPAIDVLHYAFRIELSDDSDRIEATASVQVRFRAEGLRELRLDLVGAAPERDGRGMTVRAVEGEGGPVEFIHRDDTLLIPFAEPSRRNGRARFVISYGGVPADGLRIGPNRHGQRSFFSNNWPNRARHWLPTVDHPYDKATSEFVVTAPDHYQVVSNGVLVEETDLPGGLRRTHWRQRVPIATWLFALGVTRFAVEHREPFGGVPIQTWVFQQDRDEGFHDFAVPTRRVLGFFTDRIGPFAYEKVANVQSTSVGGGMEAATAIFYAEESVTGERSERWRRVIIHELAHQWFGNAVTEYDWDDVWLSEGFATYFTLLFIEHADGRDTFVDALRDARRGVVEFYRENPDYRTVHADLKEMSRVTSYPGIYQKGAWVLHMLRRRLGDAAFWEGIRLYYGRHMNGNATTEDFRLAMEEVSGDELASFFRQWLLEGGIPTLSGRWTHDAERGIVRVELRQVGPRTFRLPVEVGVHLPGRERPRVRRITMTGRRGRVEIPVERVPQQVVLDPGTRLLADFALREEEGGVGARGGSGPTARPLSARWSRR